MNSEHLKILNEIKTQLNQITILSEWFANGKR